MITLYPAENRFTADHGWLLSKFSFSFAEYYDPQNMSFGPMRVLNDDIVQPHRGFGAHPHHEMEIVSIVLSGQLKHTDSAGHAFTTSFGGVQRMSAGTGIVHSEVNPSESEDVNFLQMWFEPDQHGLSPSYEQTSFSPEEMKNNLLPVVSKAYQAEQIAHIHQDLTIFLSDLEAGKEIEFTQNEGRKIFAFVIEGNLRLNDSMLLNRRDSVRISNMSSLKLTTDSGARLMLIDLP